jgi:hypothetical protein
VFRTLASVLGEAQLLRVTDSAIPVRLLWNLTGGVPGTTAKAVTRSTAAKFLGLKILDATGQALGDNVIQEMSLW